MRLDADYHKEDMTKGISIHVGVNRPEYFPQSELVHCEDDANAMLEIAVAAGFTPTLFRGSNATLDDVVTAIKQAAIDLESGDTFLFTFSGHGIQEPTYDLGNDPDGVDETIALSDLLLFGNQWRSELWPRFKAGVRAVAVADCCHSGGVFLILHFLNEAVKELQVPHLTAHVEAASAILNRASRLISLTKSSAGDLIFFARPSQPPALSDLVVRSIPQEVSRRELKEHKDFYARQLVPPSAPITVDRLYLTACEEGEVAIEGAQHGAFTQVLLDVWNNGKFVGNYRDFMTEIRAKFSDSAIQHPDLKPDPLPSFSSEHPFTI
jgi:metacaspase-1